MMGNRLFQVLFVGTYKKQEQNNDVCAKGMQKAGVLQQLTYVLLCTSPTLRPALLEAAGFKVFLKIFIAPNNGTKGGLGWSHMVKE